MRNDGNWMAQFSNCNNEMIDFSKKDRQLREEFEGYLKSMMDSDDDVFSVVRVKEVLDVYKKLEEK